MLPEIAGNRGFCFRKLGRIEEALEDYNDALAYEKENAQHYYERALARASYRGTSLSEIFETLDSHTEHLKAFKRRF